MIEVEMLPASYGLAAWVTWRDSRRRYRMLFDGGPTTTYEHVWCRVQAEQPRDRELELLVVSHIDGDHIEGIVRLLQDREALKMRIRDTWFNGWPQIQPFTTLGAEQGEFVAALLQRDTLPWNQAFGGAAAHVPDTGKLPVKRLRGGMTATLLSPGPPQLSALREHWREVLEQAAEQPGFDEDPLQRLAERKDLRGISQRTLLGGSEGPKRSDNSIANASSIAILLEKDGASVLLTGDAHPDVLDAGLARLCAERGTDRLNVDVLQLPHHGSRNNVTDGLFAHLGARTHLVSSDGRRYRHPDRDAIVSASKFGGVERRPVHFVFNYVTDRTIDYSFAELQAELGFTASFGGAVRTVAGAPAG